MFSKVIFNCHVLKTTLTEQFRKRFTEKTIRFLYCQRIKTVLLVVNMTTTILVVIMSASVLPQLFVNVPGKLLSSLFYCQVMFYNVPRGTFESGL